jgi:hypothetical protein
MGKMNNFKHFIGEPWLGRDEWGNMLNLLGFCLLLGAPMPRPTGQQLPFVAQPV